MKSWQLGGLRASIKHDNTQMLLHLWHKYLTPGYAHVGCSLET